jgi:2',3'-cyclic-nucleotide 2'-phosphodiesterase (5'-nucleotidase family)
MVIQDSGRKVPVVQAYAYTKYMGRLDLTFDSKGEIVDLKGKPILLDRNIAQGKNIFIQIWSKVK